MIVAHASAKTDGTTGIQMIIGSARTANGGRMTMRLIDADWLNKELQKRIGSPTDDKLYEVNLCIIDAPTIDAIPVEWAKAQIKPYAGDVSDIGQSVRTWTIKDLIRKWQKEQEAR